MLTRQNLPGSWLLVTLHRFCFHSGLERITSARESQSMDCKVSDIACRTYKTSRPQSVHKYGQSCVCYLIKESTVSAFEQWCYWDTLYVWLWAGLLISEHKTEFYVLSSACFCKEPRGGTWAAAAICNQSSWLTSNTEWEMATYRVSILSHLNRYHPLLCKKQKHFLFFMHVTIFP